jgi:hypothetical protein
MNKYEILTQVICAMINSGEMKVFAYEAKLEKAVDIANSIIEICDKGIYYKENVV